MAQEQMLLCTLLPFVKYCDTLGSDVFTESTAIQIVWRTNEVRVSGPESKSFIYAMSEFIDTSWMHLVGSQFCKLNVLFSGEEAIGIRLYLLGPQIDACFKESELCSTQFMAFEFSLSDCLKRAYFYLESATNKKKSFLLHHTDFSPKTLSVSSLISITDEVQWCFKDFTFKMGPTEDVEKNHITTLNFDSIVLAANATNHWRCTLLEQTKQYAVGENKLLIITDDPTKWPCNIVQVSENGHTLNANGIFIASSETILSNFRKQIELLDMVKVISANIFISRSESQIRRILVTNLAKKLPLFNLPLHFHKYSAIILDNFSDLQHVDLLPRNLTNRWIKVIHENDCTRPTHLSHDQLKLALNIESKVLLPLVWAPTSSTLISIKIPKQILRRFRIIGHPIRDGIVEERIARAFPNGCPLKNEDAIQRFSGTSMPGTLAAEYLTRHFQRLGSSVGEYSLPMTNAGVSVINKEFVNKSLNSEKKECCICYESLADEFNFTVCGHLYCGECSKTYFQSEFAQNKTKECAICRVNLMIADVFRIKSFSSEAPFVSVLGSKAHSIQTFTKCMRNKNVAYWSQEGDSAKNIIVDNVYSCTVNSILKKNGPLNLHIFYTKDEYAAYQLLQKNFI